MRYQVADIFHMKISTGMAEISFLNSQNRRITSESFYVWPQYNAGKVDKIQGVIRETESKVIYSKPLPEEREKLLAQAANSADRGYSSTGKMENPGARLLPGSLFDAIV